eukprot:6197582-Pleurochrysis_carterae.AAC.2
MYAFCRNRQSGVRQVLSACVAQVLRISLGARASVRHQSRLSFACCSVRSWRRAVRKSFSTSRTCTHAKTHDNANDRAHRSTHTRTHTHTHMDNGTRPRARRHSRTDMRSDATAQTYRPPRHSRRAQRGTQRPPRPPRRSSGEALRVGEEQHAGKPWRAQRRHTKRSSSVV